VTSRRELALNLSLLLVSSALSLVGAFAFLVFYMPVNPTVYQLDERCLYRLIPGSVKVFRHMRVNGGSRVTVRINRAGFRGEELADRSLVRRIVVYGDSFIEAESSPLEETFCQRLDALLNRSLPGAPVEVVNAGVGGYGPDQVSLRLPDELRSLAPDLVIVAIYAGNDFGDLLRNKLYRLGADGRLLEQRAVLSRSLQGHLARSTEAERVDGGALRRLLTALYWETNPRQVEREAGLPDRGRHEGLVAWSLRASRYEYRNYVQRGDPEVVNLFGDYYDADMVVRPGSEAARWKASLMQQVVDRIGRTLAAQGTPLLLLVIPCAIDVCPNRHFRGVEQELAGKPRSTLTDELAGIAERCGIPCVNPFESFLAKSGSTHLYYRDPETHWNAAGQELAARLTAERIVDLGLLEPRPPS